MAIDQAIEIIRESKFENGILTLPPQQLDRKLYEDVAGRLKKIGGKWTKKVNGFTFDTEAAKLLEDVRGGIERNIKKEFQFFETPAEVADHLVWLAGIKEGDCVLEPSAGRGAIIKAIYRKFPYYPKNQNDKPCVTVDYFELMDENLSILLKEAQNNPRWSSSTSGMGKDFLMTKDKNQYDVIIANPPFNKNQDIQHIRKMWQVLKPGGRIVTVSSKHWHFSKNKVETDFRNWLDTVDATLHDLEKGAFKNSGTMISSLILVINKPK